MKKEIKEIYGMMMCICLILALSVVSIFLPVNAQGGQKFFFTIHGQQRPPYRSEYGEEMARELAKIGINYIPEQVDTTTFADRQVRKGAYYGYTWDEGGYDISYPMYSWSRFDPGEGIRLYDSGYGAEILNFDRLPGPTGVPFRSIVFHRWFNPRYDKLLELSEREMDPDIRKMMIWEIMEILYDELPWIPTIYPMYASVMRKEIKNYSPGYGGGFFRGVYKIGIEGKTLADDVTLVIAQPGKIVDPSPFFFGKTDGYPVVYNTWDALMDFDEEYNLVPCLAESWEVSANGTALTFHLRDDVYWHDGVKFTSEDVKWTIETALDPETLYHYYGRLEPLKISGVDALDDYTVVVHLEYPSAVALTRLTTILRIEAKHHWEGINLEDMKNSELSAKDFVGTGPFKFVKWEKGEYMEFEANKDYFQGEPIVDHLFLKIIPELGTAVAALEAGEVGILSSEKYEVTPVLENLEANPELNVLRYDSKTSEAVMVNCQNPMLTNKWVRKAISYMIPRDHIVNDIRKGLGTPANQINPEGSWGHNTNLPPLEYNLEKAKECMETAGFDFDLLKSAEIPSEILLMYSAIGLVVGGLIGAGAGVFYRRKRVK